MDRLRTLVATVSLALALLFPQATFAQSAKRPSIVFVFMDNFGWGELGTYRGGILQGAPTPRIDSLAVDGMKLLNFNVEAQCTPSRSALMTGRYAIRSGNSEVLIGTGIYGLTQWEITISEMLFNAGYATSMFGKWHIGDSKLGHASEGLLLLWLGE